jgi:CRISPR type IV-associated protein Csf3
LLNNNRREEEEEEEEELNPTNIDRIGRTGWQGSGQVKNKEVLVDSEGSLRWRRRKRKQRRRKWCYAIQFKILVILCPLDGRHV